MRILYAVAAVAVIAFVGYFFIGEMGKYQEHTAKIAKEEKAMGILSKLAGSSDRSVIRSWCQTTETRFDASEQMPTTTKPALDICRHFGFL